ncbi:hypothetical protein LXL04_004236 [Taraxacum kok-saghyz]
MKSNRPRHKVDASGWQKVSYRRQGNKSQLPETSFFISNLPDGCNSGILWKIFQSFGKMSDAYIPPRKDKAGNNYAFIRFLQVKDANRLVDIFNSLKIDGAKITANVAKFDKNKRSSRNTAGGTAGPKPAPATSVRPFPHAPHPRNLYNGAGTRSFKDVLRKASPLPRTNSPMKSVRISDICEDHLTLWKDCSLLGEVCNMSKMGNLVVGLTAEGLQDVSIKFMGGLLAMITFKTNADANNFLVNGKPTWSNWFSSLHMWSGQPIPYQRVAWIKVEGLPLHLWDSHCFDSVGGLFGRVLSPSARPLKTSDLSVGSMSIPVNSIDKIEEYVEILWQDQRHKVFVCEDMWPWVPDFADIVSTPPSAGKDDVQFENLAPILDDQEDEREEGEFCSADEADDAFLESPPPPPGEACSESGGRR